MTLDEFRRFGDLLNSPFFNHTRLSAKCLELYRFFLDRGFENELDYEEAFAVLYPGKPYNRHLINNVMTALLEQARQFIACQFWQKSQGEAGVQLAMLKFYRERQLDNRFVQTLEKIRREQASEPATFGEERYFQRYQLETEVFDFHNLNDNQKGLHFISPVVENFRQFVVASGLKLLLKFMQHNDRSQADLEQLAIFENEIRAMRSNLGPFDEPLIYLLEMAVTLLRQDTSDQDFESFLDLLAAHWQQISPGERRQLAGIARHYCNQRINRGGRHFRPVLFQLYQSHLPLGLLYEQGRIPQANLFNMINIALGESEIEWAEQALETHRHFIAGSDYPEAIYLICKAFCLFSKRDFHAAYTALNDAFTEMANHELRIHLKDLGLNKMARVLEIKILYEIDPGASLLTDRLNAFKMYLHRGVKHPAGKRELHNNFVDFLKQLTLPAIQSNPQRAKKLLEKLDRPGFLIADRRWVTEKVEALLAG